MFGIYKSYVFFKCYEWRRKYYGLFRYLVCIFDVLVKYNKKRKYFLYVKVDL